MANIASSKTFEFILNGRSVSVRPSVTDLNGAAVMGACSQLQARLTPVAAGMLNCEPASVRFSAGQVYAQGANAEPISFREVCEAAYCQRIALFAQGYYRTPEIYYDAATLRGQPFYYCVYEAAVSEVELDGFTGDARLLRTDISKTPALRFSRLSTAARSKAVSSKVSAG